MIESDASLTGWGGGGHAKMPEQGDRGLQRRLSSTSTA